MKHSLKSPQCSMSIMLLSMAACIVVFTGMHPGMNKSSPPASITSKADHFTKVDEGFLVCDQSSTRITVVDTADGYDGGSAGAKPEWCYTAYANCQSSCYNAVQNWTIGPLTWLGGLLGGPLGAGTGYTVSVEACRAGCTYGFNTCP